MVAYDDAQEDTMSLLIQTSSLSEHNWFPDF